MGVRAGPQIVATTTLKEAEVNGLQAIIEQQLARILTQTADRAVGDIQEQVDRLKDRLTEHKRESTREHTEIRKSLKTDATTGVTREEFTSHQEKFGKMKVKIIKGYGTDKRLNRVYKMVNEHREQVAQGKKPIPPGPFDITQDGLHGGSAADAA